VFLKPAEVSSAVAADERRDSGRSRDGSSHGPIAQLLARQKRSVPPQTEELG